MGRSCIDSRALIEDETRVADCFVAAIFFEIEQLSRIVLDSFPYVFVRRPLVDLCVVFLVRITDTEKPTAVVEGRKTGNSPV
jgi:5-methylthioribose kinase